MSEFIEMDRILQEGAGKTIAPSKSKYATMLKDRMHSLGWNKSFIRSNMRALDDDMIDGYNDDHIITGLSSAWMKRYGIASRISETLVRIGVNKRLATAVESILVPLVNTCYSDKQLLQIAVDYIQDKYAPITPAGTRYLLNPGTTLQWFMSKTIRVMNIPRSCSVSLEKDIETITQSVPHIEPAIKSSYYYHTTSWRSWVSICNKIRHEKGKECLDFGLWSGFYLSKRIVDCLDWGAKKRGLFGDEIVIFVFSIPNIMPSTLRFKALKDSEWSHVTSMSRKCGDTGMELEEIADYDFIYGDMVSNPMEVSHGGEPRTHNPPKKQLVSKTTVADTFLHSRIVGCYFFAKS